jgi:hypothetical protein
LGCTKREGRGRERSAVKRRHYYLLCAGQRYDRGKESGCA